MSLERINPLKLRVTATQRGELHVSFEDRDPDTPGYDVVGFDLSAHQALALARVIHRTPTKGLEAFAALLESGAGKLPQINAEKFSDGKPEILGQIEGVEDYGYGTLHKDRRNGEKAFNE